MKALAFLLFLQLLRAGEPVVHRLPVAASVFPQGSQPGATVPAEILGEYLDRASSLVFFDADLSGSIQQVGPTRLGIQIKVSDKARLGPHYFRVVTPRGASGPLLFRIGGLPRVRDAEPNSTIEQAARVSIPVTIDGRLNADNDFDFYRFSARAGESWIFDLRAARNGNGLDAAIILMDASGRKLAHSEDEFVWDPFFLFTFRESGDYIVAVQPTHTHNDPNFAYELDIRQAPQLQTLHPIAVPPGAVTEATVFGVGLFGGGARLEFDEPELSGEVIALAGNTARVRLQIPSTAAPGVHEFALTAKSGRSNMVRFLVDPTPRQNGPTLQPPASVTSIARYRDPQRFSFEAKAGETLVFEVRANRFGSPVDSMLRILDANGKLVASNDDFQFLVADFYNRDSRISHTFKTGGTYTLELRNMVAANGENYPYQLRVTPAEPHFELALDEERPYIYPGKGTKIKVHITRFDGHSGPTEIQLSGLPSGITAAPAIIPAGQNETSITLEAASDAKPGTAASLQIQAGSQIAWKPVRIASGGGEGATFASVGKALLVVSEKPSFSLEAAASNISLPKGTSAVIPVMIRREPGFTGGIQFRLENLPAGVSLEPVTAGPDQDRVDLKVTAAVDVTPSRAARVAILGVSGAEQQEAPRISIQVD